MINRTLLLSLFDGNESFVERVIEVFKNQAPVLLAALHEGLQAHDDEKIASAAHDLKSQCRYLGLEEAGDICQLLELEPGNKDGAELYLRLEKIVAAVLV